MTTLDVPFGLIMLVGRYVFLALVYGFLYWAFRGLFAQTALEAKLQRPALASQPPTVAAPPSIPAPVAAVAPPAPETVLPEPVYAPEPEPLLAPVFEAPPAFQVASEPEPVALAKPSLLVEDAGQSNLQAGQVIDLTAAVTMGRAEDNGLVVNDKFCSTHHALIFLLSGQRMLRDRNSTNGTFHNGRRITEDVLLADGDLVGVGTVVFVYRAGDL